MKKAKTNPIQVQLKLLKVQETHFFIDSELISSIIKIEGDSINIEFGFKLELNNEKNELIIHLNVKYLYPTDSGLSKLIEIQTSNSFEITDLNNLISINENEIEDKNGILPSILGIAIGTLRGVLVAKTSESKLSDFLLPIVNPTEICNSMILQA
jgi:hypothetical protein